jgi:hypothetical protein
LKLSLARPSAYNHCLIGCLHEFNQADWRW